MGGNVIYCEEAASMNENVFFKVVVPLLEVEYTALICISTPLTEDNFYSVMTDLKDAKGNPMFSVVRLSMACEICNARRKNKKDERPCMHTINTLPAWKSGDSHEMVRALYGSRKADYDRESRGIITSDGGYAFNPKFLKHFESQPVYDENPRPDYIIVTCDPDGAGIGTNAAELGLVSAYYHKKTMVVVGLMALSGIPRDTQEAVKHHILNLRKIPRFRDCWIIFVPESNSQHACYNYTCAIQNLNRVVPLTNDEGITGMRTQKGTKLIYADDFNDYLNCTHTIRFDRDWIVGNPYEPETHENKSKIREKMFDQLRKVRQIKTGTNNYNISGKCDDNGKDIPGQNDDLAIAMMMQPTINRLMEVGVVKLPRLVANELFPYTMPSF